MLLEIIKSAHYFNSISLNNASCADVCIECVMENADTGEKIPRLYMFSALIELPHDLGSTSMCFVNGRFHNIN